MDTTSFDKIYLVYKLLETPPHVLRQGFLQLRSDGALTQYFKRLAKQLHPDKNQHPGSKEAFQRLKTALDQVRGVGLNAASTTGVYYF